MILVDELNGTGYFDRLVERTLNPLIQSLFSP